MFLTIVRRPMKQPLPTDEAAALSVLSSVITP